MSENDHVHAGESEEVDGQPITLFQPILGYFPYVLIQATPSESDEGGAELSLQAGGFPETDDSVAQIIELLEAVTEEMKSRA